jgi:hypothetical protein
MKLSRRGTMLTSGHASAAKPGAQTALRSEASAAPSKEALDYFPDHCADQVRGVRRAHGNLPGSEKSGFFGKTDPEFSAALANAPTQHHL